MAFQLSPGVNVSEIDLTTIVPNVATSIGAMAGAFQWGPVLERVTISTENELKDTFGKPDDNTFIDWLSAANFLSYSNHLLVTRVVDTTALNGVVGDVDAGTAVKVENQTDWQGTTFTDQLFVAKYPGTLGNSLKAFVADAGSYGRALTIATSIDTTATSTTVTGVGSAFDTELTVGDWITINGEIQQVATITSATVLNTENAWTGTHAVAAATATWRYYTQFSGTPGTSSYASNLGGTNDECHVIVIDEDGLFTGTADTILEKFAFVSKANDAKRVDGSLNYWVSVLERESEYVWAGDVAEFVATASASTTFASWAPSTTYNAPGGSFTGGVIANGSVTEGERQAGYNLYTNDEEVDVSLVFQAGGAVATGDWIIDNVAEVRKDCVAIVSPAYASSTSALAQADGTTLGSSSYAFMANSWKYQYDRYNDVYRWVPMDGDIAGLMARTDTTNDPWWSPAGYNRGVIKNIVKTSWQPTKAERDDLYKVGINPVVSFPGQGIVLFGDKTMLDRPSAFDRINVRRLFIVLEKAIATAAKFQLFEFNDEFTRAQFVNMVEPFLRTVMGRRGVTDFKVVCDDSNNTGDIIDRNEFVADIYIKPARSINFIQLNFIATRTGISFEEVGG